MESEREAPGNFVLSDPGTGTDQYADRMDFAGTLYSQAVVDPVTDGDTSSDQHTLDHDKLTALVSFGGLGLPHGYRAGVHAVTPSGDETSDADNGSAKALTTVCARLSFHLHPLGKVVRSALQQRANCHNNRTNEDSTLATKRITDENGEYCAAETSQVV